MTDNGKHDDDAGLETLFEAARRNPPVVPEALMARIVEDAEALAAPSLRGWRHWLASLGGTPALAGLVSATCVGFWLGVAPPQVLPDIAGTVWGLESFEDEDEDLEGSSLTGFGWDIGEG